MQSSQWWPRGVGVVALILWVKNLRFSAFDMEKVSKDRALLESISRSRVRGWGTSLTHGAGPWTWLGQCLKQEKLLWADGVGVRTQTGAWRNAGQTGAGHVTPKYAPVEAQNTKNKVSSKLPKAEGRRESWMLSYQLAAWKRCQQ